ncbi:MAG TPA: hypothetical protein VD978_19065 [Azospirillum sp.]|nr:hypothetical protein [Azospirillum sp.]
MDHASETAPDDDSLLLTDFYQLAMFQAYVENGLTQTASFELFVRTPPQRNFLIAAGLQQAVEFLENAPLRPCIGSPTMPTGWSGRGDSLRADRSRFVPSFPWFPRSRCAGIRAGRSGCGRRRG